MPVKLSELYHKYHTNLKESRATYEAHLGELAEKLDDEWEVCLKKNMFSTSPYFDSAAARIEISKSIRDFIQSSETNVPFVAIDGSSHKEQGDRFISIYGGAYCVRGELRVQGRDARISYFRHLEKEVSYVAFIPVPPEASLSLTDEAAEAEASNLLPGSDKDSFELTSMHNKIMQLAEIYAAYDLARSELEPPKLVLLDNSLSSWLGNTSFVGLYQSLIGKDFDGIKIDLADIYTTLSKPSNPSLGVPPKSTWAPHYRIIAEFAWRGKRELPVDELVRSMGSEELVNTGLKALSIYNLFEVSSGSIKLGWDPSASWSKMEQLFNQICRKLFGEVKSTGLICKSATGRDVYLSPRELQFITGIGLRLLVETCWRKKILLIGIAKDSSSSYFFRNYLGSIHVKEGSAPGVHLGALISDRTVLELTSEIRSEDLALPWSTVDFDSAFTTVLPWKREQGWAVGGYRTEKGQEYTRTPRLFLRSLLRFPAGAAATHVVFADRLAYPGWDDSDSSDIELSALGSSLGSVSLLAYSASKPSRLQVASLFLMSKLVRNLYPEALGYPDPLHRADLGAGAFRDHVKEVLKSSWLVERADPLVRTFRTLRDRIRRRRTAR